MLIILLVPKVHLKRDIIANALGRYLKTALEYSTGSETYNNLRKRNKMTKTTYSTMLLVIGFMALMLMLPSAYLNAAPIGNPNNSPASPVSNVNQTDIKGLNQSESPLLIAQTTEEHRSSESSSSSTSEAPPPVQEHRSSESSSSSTMRSTTEAPPEHCVSHCRDHYKQSLVECNEPHHPHHNKCEKWAQESEQECLASCK
jgi:cytoskeletal protein RodZ